MSKVRLKFKSTDMLLYSFRTYRDVRSSVECVNKPKN